MEPYKSYEEINPMDAGYVLSVSDADVITDIPLEDINEFLTEAGEYFNE